MIKDILKWVLQPCKPKQQTPLPAAVLLKETNTSKPDFFLLSFIFYLHFPAFPPPSCRGSELFAHLSDLAESVLKRSHMFSCLHTWHTKTFPSSHLNGGKDSSSSLYLSPLLSVPLSSVNYVLHIKAPGSLSSVQDASAVVGKVQREHSNSSTEHCLCIWWGYQNTSSRGFFALFVVTVENNRRLPHWQLFGSLLSIIFVSVDISFQRGAESVISPSLHENTTLEIYYICLHQV